MAKVTFVNLLILWHNREGIIMVSSVLYCCQGNSKIEFVGKGFNIRERSLDLESGELD